MRGEFEPYLATGFDNNQICQMQLASRLLIQRIPIIDYIFSLYMFQALHRRFKLFQSIDIRREINF